MTIGEITFYEVDGQLGAVETGTLPIAIAGQALKGAYTPRLFTRLDDVIDEYGAGDLVEAAAVQIKDWRKPALCRRVNVTDVGEATIDSSGWTGTSVATVAAGLAPIETARYRIKFVAGGTRDTDGITYQRSHDDGLTWDAVTALGTATSITFDAARVGTLTVAFGAGTIIAGESIAIATVAPVPTASETTAAVQQLGVHAQDWDQLNIAYPIDATTASAVDAEVIAMRARAKERYWIGNGRLMNSTETPVQYLAAMPAAWNGFSTLIGVILPGDCWFVSRVDGRKMRRPRTWAVGPYIDRLPRHIDPALIDNGVIPGVSLLDEHGNPQLLDESVWPGLDALRLSSIYNTADGAYIGNARIKSPQGSDYRYVQHRRVINIAKRTLHAFLRHYLSRDVLVSRKTGRMTPSYARSLRKLAEEHLRSVLGVGPMVSGFEVIPDENAQVLITEQLDVDLNIIPLGYFKHINVKVAMKNPALTVVG